MTPTIVQAIVGSPRGKSLFPPEPAESIDAVVKVYVDDRFTELDRTLYNRGPIIRRSVTNRESSAEKPLAVTVQKPSDHLFECTSTHDDNREFTFFRNTSRAIDICVKT